MNRPATLWRPMKSREVLAIGMMVVAVCAIVPPTFAAKPSAMPNSFAGTYCGYLVGSNYGSMSISDSGDVSGYFSYMFPNYFESFTLSGRVTLSGVLRLKVVHTIAVNDRGRRRRTERYSITVNVALDQSGNLVATSGASFVLERCP